MKKLKLTKERIGIILIAILSAILNFANLSIEGTANSYYAAAVKSMTMSLKNFFFVSFDPAGFVTIDKPPIGFWLQAISAKIFGFSGWSILLPSALAGVISVVLIYHIVKKSFGSTAGLISALCLAITPVFVAVSRNNTIDNILVLALLFACWTLSIAAERGKFKYLIISMVFIGIGFNIKMLEAYMIVPAVYITYLLSSAISIKKRIIHLVAGTVVLLAVSLSWALIVDSTPATSRPYVDSSTNNTVMELIVGHNGAERISLFNKSQSEGGPGGSMQQPQAQSKNSNNNPPSNSGKIGFKGGNMPGFANGGPGGNPGGGPGASGGLSGSFGGQTKASITRLFSKNILSDQIVWFIPIAFLGFIAAAIKEKLLFSLNNKRKQALVLWFIWFLPEFVYFSYNTGTFHSYYLTMLAPPVAALGGIGITSMWELYKEEGWKSWFLPIALIANGIVQLVMLNYFITQAQVVKILMILLIILCFLSSASLIILNLLKIMPPSFKNIKEGKILNLKKILVSLAFIGLLITPFVGSSAAIFHGVGGSFPAAGLEILSDNKNQPKVSNLSADETATKESTTSYSSQLDFLIKNKTKTQKYLLVVSSSNDASDIIIKSGEPVMALGGFLGNNNPLTLDQFKELAKKGEVRYVMTGGNRGGNSKSAIMSWVAEVGKAVSASEYTNSNNTNSQNQHGPGGSGQLYDLKAYTDSFATK